MIRGKSKRGKNHNNSGYDKINSKDTTLNISNSGYINNEDSAEIEGMCKFHLHNQVHILCETCNELICDKCLIEEHEGHKTEDFKIAQNNEFVINIFTNFYMKMKSSNEHQMKNFKEKINEVDKMVEKFFNEELIRVEKTTLELVNLLNNLNSKIKKLISMYQKKFKEEFIAIKEEHEKFQNEIQNLHNRINLFKNTNLKGNTRFKEFREFKNKKNTIESDCKRLLGFYDFNKTALISEFSMKDFYSFLDKNKIFLTKHYEEYTKLIVNLNVVEKINNVIGFDETKMLFSSKNFLPKNISRVYQPIDRTNQVTIYDSESEAYHKLLLFPKKKKGFSFLPFCRYLNFNGRLFVSGGYQDTRLSRTFWAVEDKSIMDFTGNNSSGNSNSKYSNLANIHNEFYSNINNQNFVFEDENYPNICVLRCADMINPRAGHSMVGLSPSLILVFGGTENTKTCEMYHFDSNRWEEIASLNETRIDPSAFIYKNFIYIFFGLRYDKSSKKYTFLDTIERISLLNMQNSDWEYVTPKFTDGSSRNLLPRSLCGIVVKHNSSSTIYLCGGQVDKEKYSNEVFEYDVELNTLCLSDKKLPKPSAFLEQNFVYLFRTGINFDIYGDMFYYHNSDSFNFQFQNFKNEK